jgi:hypothetical protein
VRGRNLLKVGRLAWSELPVIRLPDTPVIGVKERPKSRDRWPSLEEVGDAFQRLAHGARTRLRGEPVSEDQRTQDSDTIARWQRAERVDLSVEADRAREKREAVG